MKRGLVICGLLLIFASPALAQKGPQPVIVAPIQKDKFTDSVEALGTLRANETVILTATVTEPVSAVSFEDGQRVNKGDILVLMTSVQEKAELEAEQATVDEAKRQMERIQPLIKSGAASKSTLDLRDREYQTAKARLDAVQSQIADRVITAPFSGVVGMRNISVGTVLQPGTKITTIDDDSVMKLDFSVPELFLSAMKPGLEIVAKSKAFPERQFKGTIYSVDSQIDPITRSIMVRAKIANLDKTLRPGLLMSVDILKNPREAIVAPEGAIVPEARKNFVFVALKEGEKSTVKKQEVQLGARRPGEVEVLNGLKEGDLVVTHGTMNINDGADVTIRGQDNGAPLHEILEKGQKDGGGKAH